MPWRKTPLIANMLPTKAAAIIRSNLSSKKITPKLLDGFLMAKMKSFMLSETGPMKRLKKITPNNKKRSIKIFFLNFKILK